MVATQMGLAGFSGQQNRQFIDGVQKLRHACCGLIELPFASISTSRASMAQASQEKVDSNP